MLNLGLSIASGLCCGVGLFLISGIGHLSMGVAITSRKCVCRWMRLAVAGQQLLETFDYHMRICVRLVSKILI